MSRLHLILYGALIALALSFLGVSLIKLDIAPYVGSLIILVMPFLTGFVVTYRLRGPEAFFWTMSIAGASLIAAFFVLGILAIGALVVYWAFLVGSATTGVVLGVILRPWLKGLFGALDAKRRSERASQAFEKQPFQSAMAKDPSEHIEP